MSILETMVKVAYTVGRFQPPTIGHKALIQAVRDAAGPDGKAYVFVSSTMTPKAKNPLKSEQKLPILQKMFPDGITFIDTQECKDRGQPCGGALAAFYYLINNGFSKEDITLVVGDDHREDFGPKAEMWIRKEEKDVYGPGDFKFLPSAKRNPDLEVKDAANMSGTKAREYVKRNRKADFYIAVGTDGPAADAIYDIIKASLAKKGGAGATGEDVVYGADDEFEYKSRRKTRRNKASGKALYRRGSRSRSGSSRTNRSSYGFLGY